MRSGELNANARFAFGHNGIRKANHVDAFGQKLRRRALGERSVAEHDGDDGMKAFPCIESRFFHLIAKEPRVLHETGARLVVRFENFQDFDRSSGNGRRERV